MGAPHEAAGPSDALHPDGGPLQLAMPARQLADAPLAVRVRGVPIGAFLALRLRARWWSGERLASSARYHCVDGTIDVARDAPVQGYSGVEADGLVRTLVPVSAAVPTGTRRPPVSPPGPATGAGLAADVFEVCARIEAPDGVCVAATTRRDARGATVVIERVALPGVAATLYHDRERAARAPAIIAVPLLDGPAAERAASLLASHGYAVLCLGPPAAGRHLATVPTAALHAAEQALSAMAAREAPPRVVLGLDVTPDRRSPAATQAWSELLDRLRLLSVAPSAPARR